MDVQLLVIIGVAVALLTLLVYLISIFGTRSKTYEEILEEQRKQQQELFGKSASEGDKKKEKKAKKPKKPKVEKQATGDAGQAQEVEEQPHKMLNLEIDPEIIEDQPPKPISDVRKRKKSKPILHNRDEKSPVSSELEVEEKFHPHRTPKDDVEVKHERDRRLSGSLPASTDDEQAAQPPAGKGGKKKKAKEVAAVKPEPVVVQEVIQVQAAPVMQAEPPRKGKKGKNSPPPESKKGRNALFVVIVNFQNCNVAV